MTTVSNHYTLPHHVIVKAPGLLPMLYKVSESAGELGDLCVMLWTSRTHGRLDELLNIVGKGLILQCIKLHIKQVTLACTRVIEQRERETLVAFCTNLAPAAVGND